MIYAKVLNPEIFDYRVYEGDFDERFIVDGGRDFIGINDNELKDIKKMVDDYNCYEYEYYYHNSIKAYLTDMLPKKHNGKKLSPKEIHDIKKLLDSEYRYYSDYEDDIVIKCLSIIYGEPYNKFRLCGCSQGKVVYLYAPENTPDKVINYLEAIYFGTGTEIEIHDSDEPVNDVNDINGYTFYTTAYDPSDIIDEIADICNCDKKEIILYNFTGYERTEKYEKVVY